MSSRGPLRKPRLPWAFMAVMLSCFLGSFLYQYLGISIFVGYLILTQQLKLKTSRYFLLACIFVLYSFISYSYNALLHQVDAWSYVFWLISYSPPLVLTYVMLSSECRIRFVDIYPFYKKIVYFQTFLLIYKTIEYGVWVVRDPAAGTTGDANFVAFHIALVMIYEISRMIARYQAKQSIQPLKTLPELLYLTAVFVIPESTATMGFLFLTAGSMALFEVAGKLNWKQKISVISSVTVLIVIMLNSGVLGRGVSTISLIFTSNIFSNPHLGKVKAYLQIINGDVWTIANPIFGNGPSTYTSRSSVMRIPEDRVNQLPFAVPDYKSPAYATFISPIHQTQKDGSFGNFASPKTTMVSVLVELGVLGVILFGSLLLFPFYRPPPVVSLQDQVERLFLRYISIFFVMHLFHLNIWEYPIITFTYVFFCYSIVRQKRLLRGRMLLPSQP